MKGQQMGQLPETVNILNDDNSVSIMKYKDLKNHEESIIEDNIGYGLLHAEYSEKEIRDYEKNARAEWKALKDILRKDPNVKLRLDITTERYVVALQVIK